MIQISATPADCQPGPVFEMGQGRNAVVFLHGLFSEPLHWRPIMAGLADRYRVIAPQLPVDRQPGRRQTGMRTIGQLTDYVEQLIERLGLENFVLCGNSLGGLAAIDFSIRHPGRVAGLVLAGSAGLHERNLSNGSRMQPTRAFVRAMASDIIYNQRIITDQVVDQWCVTLKDRDYIRFVLRVARATRDRSVKDELHRLKLPTLLVWGRNDQVTPPSVGEEFARLIDGAQLKLVDHCGHAPNLEKPAAMTRMLREFLPRCFSDAAPGRARHRQEAGGPCLATATEAASASRAEVDYIE